MMHTNLNILSNCSFVFRKKQTGWLRNLRSFASTTKSTDKDDSEKKLVQEVEAELDVEMKNMMKNLFTQAQMKAKAQSQQQTNNKADNTSTSSFFNPNNPYEKNKKLIAPPHTFDLLTEDRIVRVTNSETLAQCKQDLLSQKVVGFDTEWRPYYTYVATKTEPHLLQFATTNKAYLIPFVAMPGMFQTIEQRDIYYFVQEYLQDKRYIKVGYDLFLDHKFLRDYKKIQISNRLDLKYALNFQFGLSRLVNKYLMLDCKKDSVVRESDWAKDLHSFTSNQVIYAGNDAYLCLLVYLKCFDYGKTSANLSQSVINSMAVEFSRQQHKKPNRHHSKPTNTTMLSFEDSFVFNKKQESSLTYQEQILLQQNLPNQPNQPSQTTNSLDSKSVDSSSHPTTITTTATTNKLPTKFTSVFASPKFFPNKTKLDAQPSSSPSTNTTTTTSSTTSTVLMTTTTTTTTNSTTITTDTTTTTSTTDLNRKRNIYRLNVIPRVKRKQVSTSNNENNSENNNSNSNNNSPNSTPSTPPPSLSEK